jgi:hypothetical protein
MLRLAAAAVDDGSVEHGKLPGFEGMGKQNRV